MAVTPLHSWEHEVARASALTTKRPREQETEPTQLEIDGANAAPPKVNLCDPTKPGAISLLHAREPLRL